jgi:hypothetical protein
MLTTLLVITIAPANATSPSVGKQQVAVLEAALRWALPSDWSPSSPGRVYLAIDNHEDPSDELLARLRDITNLRQVSECPKIKVGDREYPKPEPDSVVILLADFRWHGQKQQRASVGVTHWHGPLSASGCTEYFQSVKGRWVHTQPRADEDQVCGIA